MKKHHVLAAMLAAAPFVASAADNGLSYTYVEGGYTQARIDHDEDELLGDFDADGGYLRGSFGISKSVYLFGSYARGEDNDTVSVDLGLDEDVQVKVDDELTTTEFGVGFHSALGERVDFIGELAYFRMEEDFKVSAEGESETDSWHVNGGRASVGVRGGSEHVEGWVKVGYLDASDFSGNFVGGIGGQYKFNPTWSVVGEVEVFDDLSRYMVGVRASF
jgi:predicted nucleotidyltransferase